MFFSNKKIIIDALVYIILPKLSFIASLLILPWISPYLTLEDYGIFGLLMSYITVFQVFIGLGQVILLQNSFFTHKKHYKLVWRRSFGLMIFVAILCIFFFSLLLNLTIADKLGNKFLFIIFLVSIYLLLSPLDSILINFYSLKEKSFPYALGMGIVGLISTIVTIVTIKYLKMGYIGWLISLALTSVLTHLYFFKSIYINENLVPEFRLNKRFLKKSLKIGLPLSPHQLSLYILGISDRLLLQYYRIPIRDLGFYSQGYSIGSQGSILVSGIFQAFTKRIQDAFRSDDILQKVFLRKIILLIPFIISFFLFIASLWTKEVFLLLFRNIELQKSYPITIMVLNSYMFWSLYGFFTYPLSISNNTFSISKITILAATINIIGNLIFIPFYGIWGSLIVTYISYFVFGFAGLLNNENRNFLKKYINISKVCLYSFFLNISFLVISYSAKDINMIYKLLVTVALLPVGMIYIKRINKL
jgi:O-antigen/teichoic acid export membrane protein